MDDESGESMEPTEEVPLIGRANLNPMARWPFVSLGRYSRQSISCFLR